jgi:hypothetical protein
MASPGQSDPSSELHTQLFSVPPILKLIFPPGLPKKLYFLTPNIPALLYSIQFLAEFEDFWLFLARKC